MTQPPLPASPCLRVRLVYAGNANTELGNRFYLSYAGAAPTAGDCTAIAAGVEAAWVATAGTQIDGIYALTEVDVLDIASYVGLSGQWIGNEPGTNVGTGTVGQVAMNVEFDIARRYRGGKPRIYWPPGTTGDIADEGHWTPDYITAVGTQTAAFFAQVEAISQGAVGVLKHVNLSYYESFTNIENSSGRMRAVPKYRAAALVDVVNGYAPKAVLGSQRRRRTSTTP